MGEINGFACGKATRRRVLFFQNLNLLLPPFTLEGNRPFPVTHPSGTLPTEVAR